MNDRSLVDEYLAEKEVDGKIREKNTLYLTELVSPCMRKSYYGVTIDTSPDKEALRIFMSGNLIEEFWVNEVLHKSKEIKVLGTQLPARYIDPIEGFEIHGRIDVLAQHDNRQIYIHEVKSAKTCAWLTAPKPAHEQQLQFYLNILGIDLGVIDMLDKTIMLQGEDPRSPGADRGVDKSFVVTRNPEVLSTLVQRARVLHRALQDKTPPPKSECWLCQGAVTYCDYVNECRGQTKLDSPPVSS